MEFLLNKTKWEKFDDTFLDIHTYIRILFHFEDGRQSKIYNDMSTQHTDTSLSPPHYPDLNTDDQRFKKDFAKLSHCTFGESHAKRPN